MMNYTQGISCLFLLLFFMSCSALNVFQNGPNADLVTYLPGLHYSPKFQQYSGYLQASESRLLHYWFVTSQKNPKSDPVVLWMNGGPGCSSLDGFLSELGPFHLLDDGENLYENKFSWNKVANVLFLEAPAGVGFSYAINKNYTSTDDQTAKENYVALQDFFKKFPEYVNNDFYITGESYAGIYVPTLATEILKDTTSTIKLKGVAIGNGFLDADLLDDSLIFFAYYHGLLGVDLWKNLLKNCCTGPGDYQCDFHGNKPPHPAECQDSLGEAFYIVYSIGLNVYALYRDCDGGVPTVFPRYQRDMKNLMRNYKFKTPLLKMPPVTNEGYDPPCYNGSNLSGWLNRRDVRHALHIPDFVQSWSLCSNLVDYHNQYNTMRPQFLSFLGKIRALIYNGDTDMACNFLGDEWFSEGLNKTVVVNRRAWIYNKQIAGFVKEFQNLTYVTVKGSGHMVPQWAPGPALQMITSFLYNLPY